MEAGTSAVCGDVAAVICVGVVMGCIVATSCGVHMAVSVCMCMCVGVLYASGDAFCFILVTFYFCSQVKDRNRDC